MLQGQIFIDKEEHLDDKPLYEFIMRFLNEHGILGATCFTGHSGFGKNSRMKRPNDFFSFDEPPMMIIFIDEDEKVRKTLASLQNITKRGFITVHNVEKW
jgi:hypothetical protein